MGLKESSRYYKATIIVNIVVESWKIKYIKSRNWLFAECTQLWRYVYDSLIWKRTRCFLQEARGCRRISTPPPISRFIRHGQWLPVPYRRASREWPWQWHVARRKTENSRENSPIPLIAVYREAITPYRMKLAFRLDKTKIAVRSADGATYDR